MKKRIIQNIPIRVVVIFLFSLFYLSCPAASSEMVQPLNHEANLNKPNSIKPRTFASNSKEASKRLITIADKQKISIWASSTLKTKSDPKRYDVENLFDRNLSTAWVEGADRDGIDEYINITFENEVLLDGLIFYPGYLKNKNVFTKNSTPRRIELVFDKQLVKSYTITYDLKLELPQESNTKKRNREVSCYHTGNKINFSPRLIVFPEPIKATSFKLIIKEVIAGSHFSDLAISELKPIFHNFDSDICLIKKEILSLIRKLRDKKYDFNTASNIHVEDLRRKFIFRDPGKGYEYHDNLPKTTLSRYHKRINDQTKNLGSSIYDKFIKYTASHFIDKPLVIFSTDSYNYIIGSRSKSYGDSEWIEFYPTIILDKSGSVSSIKELSYSDGAPGCHNVIPPVSR